MTILYFLHRTYGAVGLCVLALLWIGLSTPPPAPLLRGCAAEYERPCENTVPDIFAFSSLENVLLTPTAAEPVWTSCSSQESFKASVADGRALGSGFKSRHRRALEPGRRWLGKSHDGYVRSLWKCMADA